MNKYVKAFFLFFLTLFLSVGLINQASAPVHGQEAGKVQEIQERGTLRLGTSADFPPFEFHAEIDGQRQITGMDIMIGQDIADELGVELEIHDMSFDSLIPALEAGTIDIIIAGLTPTPEREEAMLFSEPYYLDSQNLVTLAGEEDQYQSLESLQGTTLGAQSGSVQEGIVYDIEGAEPMILSSISDLLIALESGRVDALVLNEAPALLQTAQNDNLTTFTLDIPDDDEYTNAIGMNLGNEDLKQVIDGVIADLVAEGQVEEYLNLSVDYFVEAGIDPDEAAESQGLLSFLQDYGPYFLEGALVTIFISVVSVAIGLILGVILALMRISDNSFFSGIATAYIEFVRGTPLMIQVMFIFFGFAVFYPLSAIASGIIAVSLNSGAYICEIIRSGLSSVDKGQGEAARSLGMSRRETLQHITFPQALKNIWPSLGNEFITIIKESSIVSVIGVAELTFQSRVVRSISFRGILPLFITMVIYFILTYSLTKLLNYMEGRMNHD